MLGRMSTLSRISTSNDTLSRTDGYTAKRNAGAVARRAAGCIVAGILVIVVSSAQARAQTGFVHWETPHVHPLDLTPSGTRLLAVNTADNRLEVFDATGATPVAIASIPVGLDPVSVRARSDAEAWVVNHISDSISVVDLASGRVVRTIFTGDEPCDVVFAGTPQRAYVSVSQLNQVRVFDPANPTAAATILNIQGEDPRSLAVSPDGAKVYAAIFESGNATGVIRQQDVSNPTGPYGGQNPPPNAGAAFSPAQRAGNPAPPPVAQIVRRSSTGAWLDDNARIWTSFVTWNVLDHDVAIIDTATLGITYANSMMTNVMSLAVKPDGTVTAVGTEARNEIRFEPNVQSIFVKVLLGSFNPATPGTVGTTDLNPHLTYAVRNVPQATRDLAIGDPRGVVWHPTTGAAYVSGMGSNNVIVVSAAGARISQINVGQGPTGLALKADGSTLYAINKFDGSISVIDTATNSESTRVAFFDPTPAVVKNGRPLLYDTHATSGLGQVSCASCHIDGRTDFLAWDLGDPSGTVKAFNQNCRTPTCRPWHPMKGPMVTQSLQDIIGVEPLHWRGDRANITEFAPAFVGLQGDDAEPSTALMNQMGSFLATINYPPNPTRTLDGTLPATLNTSTGAGNPVNGLNVFTTVPTLPPPPGGGPGTTCNGCHALPTGTTRQIDDPNLPLAPQPLKIAQLRAMHEKDGWRRNSATNTKTVGFNHHSEFDTLFNLMGAGFNFGPEPGATVRKRDVEAFMLCLDTDTHAGIGQQVTFTGANNFDATLQARLTTFIALANANTAGLVAHGRVNGADRGYVYTGSGIMQADRHGEIVAADSLRTGASAGNEITFTVVPIGTQVRMGIDRDSDGYYDREEIVGGGDPANAAIVPVPKADLNSDTLKNSDDVVLMVGLLLDPTAGTPTQRCAADMNYDDQVNGNDIAAFTRCVTGAGCP